MLHEQAKAVTPLRLWTERVIYAVIIGLITIGLLIVAALLLGDLFDQPPVNVVSADPSHLGEICPGEEVPINNVVEIEKPVVAIYYISVMDRNAIYNLNGTQIVYNGYQHPVPGMFDQTILWVVPELQPGIYTRGFAARGTNAEEETVFITNTFTIPNACLKETSYAKPSSNYRISQNSCPNCGSLVSLNGSLADDP